MKETRSVVEFQLVVFRCDYVKPRLEPQTRGLGCVPDSSTTLVTSGAGVLVTGTLRIFRVHTLEEVVVRELKARVIIGWRRLHHRVTSLKTSVGTGGVVTEARAYVRSLQAATARTIDRVAVQRITSYALTLRGSAYTLTGAL